MPAHSWFWAGAVAGAMGFMALVWHGVDYRTYLRKNQKDTAAERSIHRFQWWLTLGVFIVTFGGLQIPVDELRAALVLWLVFSGLAETWWMFFGHNQNPHALTPTTPNVEAHDRKPITPHTDIR
ncbi:hypothetical protein [Arthrobacter sp. 2MCAF14]|uniref:hypothetical protein n=1 Tax=Arthrobacter sp. 2MCAF14 TaxID=3232982 RepID=UPI003F8F4B60